MRESSISLKSFVVGMVSNEGLLIIVVVVIDVIVIVVVVFVLSRNKSPKLSGVWFVLSDLWLVLSGVLSKLLQFKLVLLVVLLFSFMNLWIIFPRLVLERLEMEKTISMKKSLKNVYISIKWPVEVSLV